VDVSAATILGSVLTIVGVVLVVVQIMKCGFLYADERGRLRPEEFHNQDDLSRLDPHSDRRCLSNTGRIASSKSGPPLPY
jgi:hypothetical protein